MTVLIAGAGIGGLSLGLSLHQLGIPFQIYESVNALRPLGVGINLQPHAVRELQEMGFTNDLDGIGLRTEQVAYYSAQGDPIWSEPRGEFAGYNWPQYSIHRGELQMLLYRQLIERAGPDCIVTGAAVADWQVKGEQLHVSIRGRDGGYKVSGDVLVAADGINSTIRKKMYPNDAGIQWGGTMMWRGVTIGPKFLGGRTMAMAGRKDTKFVCYPIRDIGQDMCLINWIADRALPADTNWASQDWNREGKLRDFYPAFEEWTFDWLDIPWLIDNAESIWEFPMVDRNPLEQWSFGRVTLLGDAAHAMYPIGSNGASQAIIDARFLARELRDKGVGQAALLSYDQLRREKVNAVVLANRGDGPDKVLDIVAERAPDGFADINDVISEQELKDHAAGYKATAGMDIDTLNNSPSILPQ